MCSDPESQTARGLKNPLAHIAAANIYCVMVTDILLGLVFVLIFFVLGGIAFAYLVKGKN